MISSNYCGKISFTRGKILQEEITSLGGSCGEFLPSANEVWGKVMFSEAFVCPRRGVGVSVRGGLCLRGLCPGGAGSTHPTGMLSFVQGV